MTTMEAVSAGAIALLPGALYVWGFERQVGRWGIGLSDRVLRFFGTSALIHALIAPATYWLSARYATGTDSASLPPTLWAAAVGYVMAPFLAGGAVGRATRRGSAWATVLTGPNPAPRAWDHFFGSNREGWIRLRLKSGTWVGGIYSAGQDEPRSYASGLPHAQDLLLTDTVALDAVTGEFRLVDGSPVRRGVSLLIRWEEVEFLEVHGQRNRNA